jgi:hypothetical protein
MGKSYLTLEGVRVTKDPYWGYNDVSTRMVRFPVVNYRKYKEKERRDFYLLNVYGAAALGLEKQFEAKQFKMGVFVNAIGRLNHRKYTNSYTGQPGLSLDLECFDCEVCNSWKYQDSEDISPEEMEFSEGNLGLRPEQFSSTIR